MTGALQLRCYCGQRRTLPESAHTDGDKVRAYCQREGRHTTHRVIGGGRT